MKYELFQQALSDKGRLSTHQVRTSPDGSGQAFQTIDFGQVYGTCSPRDKEGIALCYSSDGKTSRDIRKRMDLGRQNQDLNDYMENRGMFLLKGDDIEWREYVSADQKVIITSSVGGLAVAIRLRKSASEGKKLAFDADAFGHYLSTGEGIQPE